MSRTAVTRAVGTLIGGALAVMFLHGCGEGSELGGKHAWAALQAVEFNDRNNRTPGPILRRLRNGYVVLGIPGLGNPDIGVTDPPASRRSWIILNEHSSTRTVRQINTYLEYDLDCTYVGSLKARVPDLDDYVLVHLRTICQRSRP